MAKNFRQRLRSHEKLIGTIVTLPCSASAELLSRSGFDWLFIDAEHAPLSMGQIQAILQTSQPMAPCLVRIPANSEVYIKQVLDIGADGIIAPLVNSADQAERIVRHAKYPPVGTRSVGLARAQGYGRTFTSYLSSANTDLSVVVQVEHIEAVNNLDSILAVEGIDAIFLGPYDLSASLGKPGQIADSEVQEAISEVKSKCHSARMPLGAFAIDAVAAKPLVDDGYTLIAAATDTCLLADAAQRVLAELK